jgi:hypothetical protein
MGKRIRGMSPRLWTLSWRASVLGLIGALLVLSASGRAEGQAATGERVAKAYQVAAAQIPNKTFVPDLSGGTEWLNTAKPLTLEDLRGRVVLLDFWTLC